MLLDVIKQLNWIDLLIIIILIRVSYVAFKNGIIFEFFKLLGLALAVYVSLHYYTNFSDALLKALPISEKYAPLEFMDFIAFSVLVLVTYTAFILVRMALTHFIQTKALPALNKWGGLALGILRGFLLSSLIMFMFVVSSTAYLKESVVKSYSGREIFKIAPATYSFLWNDLFSKFMQGEKFNKTVSEISQSVDK